MKNKERTCCFNDNNKMKIKKGQMRKEEREVERSK